MSHPLPSGSRGNALRAAHGIPRLKVGTGDPHSQSKNRTAKYNSPVIIQVDPLASLLAAASAIISIWALYVAKRAPLQERTRNHRDIVRNALTEAVRSFEPLETAVSTGQVVPSFSDEIPVVRRAIEEYGNRLPEYRQSLQLLDVQLLGLQSRWKTSLRAEEDVAWEQSRVAELEEIAHKADPEPGLNSQFRQDLTETRARVERAKRARDASLNELEQALTETRSAATTYIRKWDREDRSGTERV